MRTVAAVLDKGKDRQVV